MPFSVGPLNVNVTSVRRKPPPKTVTVFDGYLPPIRGNRRDTMTSTRVTDNQLDQPFSRNVNTPKSLIIESLVEQLCVFHEPEQGNRTKLFLTICQNLSNLRVLGDSSRLETMQHTRLKFRIAFEKYISDVRNSIKLLDQPSNDMFLRISIPDWNRQEMLASSLYQYCVPKSDFYEPFPKQYERDFEEISVIDRGGFGIVCKALKKVDRVEYAVKKIPFTYHSDPLIPKVLREVEVFARLAHNNVVNYKTAWIETQTAGDISALFESSAESSLDKGLFSTVTKDEVIDKVPESPKRDSFNFESTKLSDEEYNSILDQMCDSVGFEETYSTTLRKENGSESFVDEEQCDNNLRRRHWSGGTNKSASESELDKLDNAEMIDHKTQKNSMALVPTYVRSQSANAEHPFLFGGRSFPFCTKAILYVQMELCHENLRNWLDKRNRSKDKTIEFKRLTDIFKQILKGVQYLHQQTLMHRDLKPQNILFDHHGKVKIGDFGLATACCAINIERVKQAGPFQRLHHSQGVGTSPYAAPEVKNGTNYDLKADMYSLGVVLLELFQPFETTMERAKVFEDLSKSTLPSVFRELYPEQANMVIKLTSQDPKQRPDTTAVLNSTLFLSKSQVIAQQGEEIIRLKNQLELKQKEVAKFKNKLKYFYKLKSLQKS